MGTDGMSFSLQSRDLIADSIETVMGAQWYDALIALPGCDKNMPGCVMAMARLNRPSIMVYGGTIKPGFTHFSGEDAEARHRQRVPVLRRMAHAARSPKRSARMSSATPAPAPARAAGCTPPTPWPAPSRRWA